MSMGEMNIRTNGTVYSILSKNSIISGIAFGLRREPAALTASRAAALVCNVLSRLIASWYVLAAIVLEQNERLRNNNEENL